MIRITRRLKKKFLREMTLTIIVMRVTFIHLFSFILSIFRIFRIGRKTPRLRSQTESRYVQTVPDGKCLCPERPRQSVYVQTLVRLSMFPDYVNLNARHPYHAFIWAWIYRLSVWDLNLGRLVMTHL